MMIRKRRESKKTVLVVLEGVKVFSERRGVAPLSRAMHDVVNPDDEILVLTLLYVRESETSFEAGSWRVHRCNQLWEEDPCTRFLQEEISQKKDAYKQIFRRFYDSCKSIGVMFQVKIVAGFRVRDIIVEEANNIGATWIVMDSCFASHLSFRLHGTDYSVSLVNDNEEDADTNSLNLTEWSEDSVPTPRSSKSPKLMKGSTATEERRSLDSLSGVAIEHHPCTSSSVSQNVSCGSEMQTKFKSDGESETCIDGRPPKGGPILPKEMPISRDVISVKQQKGNSNCPSNAHIWLGMPMELSWEVIVEITQMSRAKMCTGQNINYWAYSGFLKEHGTYVLVKKFQGDHVDILEAERKAALSLHHKNILRLLAYHRTETSTILVFPHVYDLTKRRWDLKFEERLKIVIGIAQGVRYIHEECPRGPVVHGQLDSSNIYLTEDLKPLISGFDSAKWLQLEQDSQPPVTSSRCAFENSLDHGSMTQIKSDVFSFGVLLLRLFCRKSVPEDDKTLVEWARPLLLQRAFHLLLDEEHYDMYAIYRVMAAATLCTKTKPISRPSMSEVISILKGENFCNMQSSPSDNSA